MVTVDPGLVFLLVIFGFATWLVWRLENETQDKIATVRHIIPGEKMDAVSLEAGNVTYGPRFFKKGTFEKGQEILIRVKGSFGRDWWIVPREEYDN